MHEIDFYLPTTRNDGGEIDPQCLAAIKDELGKTFDGYTQVTHQSEGLWKLGGITFRDHISIIRVLDDGRPREKLAAMKRRFADLLGQKQLLVVAREVTIV